MTTSFRIPAVGVPANLCKENQPYRNTNQRYAAWAFRGSEEELNDCAHQRVTSMQLRNLRPCSIHLCATDSAHWMCLQKRPSRRRTRTTSSLRQFENIVTLSWVCSRQCSQNTRSRRCAAYLSWAERLHSASKHSLKFNFRDGVRIVPSTERTTKLGTSPVVTVDDSASGLQ
jgi:hypothetical protein